MIEILHWGEDNMDMNQDISCLLQAMIENVSRRLIAKGDAVRRGYHHSV